MQPSVAIFWLFASWAALAATTGYALWSGGPPERIAATAILAATALSWIVVRHDGLAFRQFEEWLAIIDVAMLSLLLMLMSYAARYWPIMAAVFQVVPCLGHLLRLADDHLAASAYARMTSFSAWPHLALLAIGTLMHRRRVLRRYGDPSWTRLLPANAKRVLSFCHLMS